MALSVCSKEGNGVNLRAPHRLAAVFGLSFCFCSSLSIMPKIIWETIETETKDALSYSGATISRSKILGGWLVYAGFSEQGGVTFVPDPQHQWDGGSLP